MWPRARVPEGPPEAKNVTLSHAYVTESHLGYRVDSRMNVAGYVRVGTDEHVSHGVSFYTGSPVQLVT
jgi:hypothetical protein